MRDQIQVQIFRVKAPTPHKAALSRIETILRYSAAKFRQLRLSYFGLQFIFIHLIRKRFKLYN